MTTEKDETFTVLVKGKPLATVKAHLIHAFLSVRKISLIHYVLNQPKNTIHLFIHLWMDRIMINK